MTTELLKPVPAIWPAIGIPEFCFLLASVTIVIGMSFSASTWRLCRTIN